MHNIPVLVGLTIENNGHTKVKTTGTQHRRNYQMTISTCTWLQDALWEPFPLPARWNWMNALHTACPLHCDMSGEESSNSLKAVIQHTYSTSLSVYPISTHVYIRILTVNRLVQTINTHIYTPWHTYTRTVIMDKPATRPKVGPTPMATDTRITTCHSPKNIGRWHLRIGGRIPSMWSVAEPNALPQIHANITIVHTLIITQ